VNIELILSLHKLVKYPEPTSSISIGGQPVNQQVTFKSRKELEAEMATIFGGKIKQLSTELQKILLDDMVTAFENRLNVLKRANAKRLH